MTVKVWIADDNDYVRRSLERMMRQYTQDVVSFFSGDDLALALSDPSQAKPEYLILDNTMPPGPQGIDILNRMNREGVPGQIKKIAFFTTYDPKDFEGVTRLYNPEVREKIRLIEKDPDQLKRYLFPEIKT
ncbi:hypothetical protein HZB00_01320 [Candidatus Woesearchaeota archaeon]|nr:hypothetical protein [Candidatus Woesearchaeota archaeon]